MDGQLLFCSNITTTDDIERKEGGWSVQLGKRRRQNESRIGVMPGRFVTSISNE
jgi:hypothetical protein